MGDYVIVCGHEKCAVADNRVLVHGVKGVLVYIQDKVSEGIIVKKVIKPAACRNIIFITARNCFIVKGERGTRGGYAVGCFKVNTYEIFPSGTIISTPSIIG